MSEVYTKERLAELQAMSLDEKIEITQDRIEDWYMQFSGNVYVSFSGGKDSTVLLHLVREMFPDVPAVFCDTGLEYPEVRQHVREMKNVVILRPKMTFPEVIKTYGYPMVSKEVAEAIYYARRTTKKINNRRIMLATAASTYKELSMVQAEKQSTVVTSQSETSSAADTFFWGGTARDNQETPRPARTPKQKRDELTGHRFGGGYSKSRYNKEKWFKLAVYAPFRISHYCCSVMKKQPMKKYHRDSFRVPIIGTMAEESNLRRQAWLRHGCNAFHSNDQKSQPLSFWTEQDVLEYIRRFKLKIPSVYGDIVEDGCRLCTTGCQRTGCTFCAFGAHLEKGESRFQMLAKTHPKLYRYCIDGGQWIDNPDYDPSISKEPNEIGWIEWNPRKLWVPSKDGLGMGNVFDLANAIYDKEMWRY